MNEAQQGQEGQDSRVVDKEKAEAMATAGDWHRTRAAHARDIDSTIEAFGHDQDAEKLEYWAGILHNNPTTESTPEELVRMEYWGRQNEHRAERILEYGIKTDPLAAFSELHDRRRDLIEEAAIRGNINSEPTYSVEEQKAKLNQQLDDLVNNPDTTIAQLKKFYDSLLMCTVAALEQDAVNTESFLEKVRKGQPE